MHSSFIYAPVNKRTSTLPVRPAALPGRRCQPGRRGRTRGVATVEFALTLPVLLLFFWASIEFARGSMIRHAVDNAAYEACRTVIVPGATVAEATTAANKVLNPLGITGATVTVTPNPILETTTQVTCRVSANINSSMWGTPRFLAGKTLVSQSTLVAERTPSMQATVLGP